MSASRESVALALRNARANRGLSQQVVAHSLGLSRSVLAQIELGNRPVSPEELTRLGVLYRRSGRELGVLPDQEGGTLLTNVLSAVPRLDDRRIKSRLQAALDLCAEALTLEQFLGRIPAPAPHYDVAPPRNIADAIAQGERTARQERLRLGLGSAVPVGDVATLLRSQGVFAVALALPEDVVGLYVRHPSVGTTIIAAGTERPPGQRVGLLHGYAHGLFDRSRTVIATTPINAGELSEVRADAFAIAFLLPRAGVELTLAALDKGGQSRQTHSIYGSTSERAIEGVVRATPGSQTLTQLDVAWIARIFGTAYAPTVYRLLALGLLSRAEATFLLRRRNRRIVREFGQLFRVGRWEDPRQEMDEDMSCLRIEVAHLACEAYRRNLIDQARLMSVISKLQVSEAVGSSFVALAQSASRSAK